MEISCARRSERQSECVAVRADGVTVRVPGYGPALPLPHEVAHCIIERKLALTRGFGASGAMGTLIPGLAVLAGRQCPHAAERSKAIVKQNRVFVGQAEILVGVFAQIIHDGLETDPSACRRRITAAQSTLGDVRWDADEAAIVRVCAALRQAAARWHELPAGGSLQFCWPDDAPRRGGRRAVRRHAHVHGQKERV